MSINLKKIQLTLICIIKCDGEINDNNAKLIKIIKFNKKTFKNSKFKYSLMNFLKYKINLLIIIITMNYFINHHFLFWVNWAAVKLGQVYVLKSF